MMVSRLGWPLGLAAFLAISSSGCDDGSGGSGADLVGTWVRSKNLVIGNHTRNDSWTVTFYKDGTFDLLHQRTEALETDPLEGVESRQGTYTVNEDGTLSITGEWLDLGAEVTSLADLEGNFYTYTQDTQFVVDEDRGLLFIGPDFNYGSSYTWGDSYNLLYNDGANNYTRTSHLVLLDTDGNTVEERAETYSFSIVDNVNCEGSYSSLVTQGGSTIDDSGTFTACTYAWDPGEAVEAIGGGTETVSAVRFEYSTGGGDYIEYYIGVGDHLLGYRVGYQSLALIDSAFVRAD